MDSVKLLTEWVMDLPCGCRLCRPSKKDGQPDYRFCWRVKRVNFAWNMCGHFVGDKVGQRQSRLTVIHRG